MVGDAKPDDGYLSVGEAAAYLGVSVQTLRRWDASGKLRPVRHPASGYRFYKRADLEPFRIEYAAAETSTQPAEQLFQTAAADVEGNERLRDPQREAHEHVRRHFATEKSPAIVQLPVGCGKTGVIATLPFGIAKGRVLVIAPNLTIRKTIFEELDISSPECFWTKTKVLANYRFGPFAAVLDGPEANIHDCTESHFVVTNIQQLASSADRWLPQFPPNFFEMILVDEAHHDAAPSWRKVFQRFPEAKVVGLTATPFRSDEQPLAGKVIYRYPFSRAMVKGYIKHITSRNVAPAEIHFTYKDDKRRHTLEEVMELREEAWFRRGVALSEECNRHIAEASIRRCNALREQTGSQQQIVAAACSVDHARQVRRIYEECGLRAHEIHSDMEDEEKERVLSELRQGRLDCIVQVQMLGEGFNHPRLSIAAIFRPFRSLAPYVQFVGRIMRVIHQNDPDHPANEGFIVSHVGLNNDARWVEFRELDLEDQKLFQMWLAGPTEEPPTRRGGGGPRRFDTSMRVDNEFIDRFIDQPFLDPEDSRVLDKLLAQKLPGVPITVGDLITREQLQAKLREKHKACAAEQPSELPVQPQRRRRAARDRLAERTNSVAARVLNDLGLSRAGRDIARVVRTARGAGNYQALLQLIHGGVNEHLGIKSRERSKLSAEQAKRAYSELDAIGDKVRESVRKALGGKKSG